MKGSVDWRDPYSAGAFIVSNALDEDRAEMDAATGALDIDPSISSVCSVKAREETVVAGWFLLQLVYGRLSRGRCMDEPLCRQLVGEGESASPGSSIGTVEGSPDLLLRGERIALNLLGRLSGIASLTKRYVDTVRDLNVDILDTRKTTPCLRALEKYAVRMGGGVNHRFDLMEMAMLKDNHLAVAGGSRDLGDAVRRLFEDGVPVEIEVDNLDQFEEVLKLQPQRILLDNMTPSQLREAVKIADGRNIYLEASGGISLDNLREVAETGVDGISSGALTHSATWADIGFDWGMR